MNRSYLVTVHTYDLEEYSRIVEMNKEQHDDLEEMLCDIVDDNEDWGAGGAIARYTIETAPPVDTLSEVQNFILEVNRG
jgi:hypothetical protein